MAEQNLLFIQLYNLLCEMREFYCDEEALETGNTEEESHEVEMYKRGTKLITQCRPLIGTAARFAMLTGSEGPAGSTTQEPPTRGDWRTAFPGAEQAAAATPRIITREQLKAVIDWAEANGRYWKSKLGDAWMKAGEGVPGYNPFLHQARYTIGPTALQGWTLKKLTEAYKRTEYTIEQ
jgi:hypothetical protein